MNKNLIVNRFRANSVGGRIVKLLADGKPRSVAEVARVAKPRSVLPAPCLREGFPEVRALDDRRRKDGASASQGCEGLTPVRLTLYVMRGAAVVDVIHVYPAAFYGFLPPWLATFPDCTIHARFEVIR